MRWLRPGFRVERYSAAYPFGDVVQSNRYRNSYAQAGVMQGRKESCQPFREVVDRNRKCGEQTHAQKLSLIPTMVVDAMSHLLVSPSDRIEIRQGGGGVAEAGAISFSACVSCGFSAAGIRLSMMHIRNIPPKKDAALIQCPQ